MRAPEELRAEHQNLSEDFVYNQRSWDRVKIFVAVEVPIRTMLRISDGHAPNLAEIPPLFEQAKVESLEACRLAEAKYPTVYPDLMRNCQTFFDKRKVDIVSLLCLAATMVLPRHVYITADRSVYNPDGGQAAILSVIDRYYSSVGDQIKAICTYNSFRSRSGNIFGLPRTTLAAANFTADVFWSVASSMADSTGCELFRKLVNGYSGQGESERMNKQVKKFRTTTRNRQTQAITASYMELDTTYKMINMREKGKFTAPYIDCLRDKILDITKEVEDSERNLQDDANGGSDEDDDENEMEYSDEIPDLGRDALIALLNAATAMET